MPTSAAGLGRGREARDRRLPEGPSEREGRDRQRRPSEQADVGSGIVNKWFDAEKVDS
jgi:hypothetical protein